MARRAEHEFIAVNVTADQADLIEERFAPMFTLALYPESLQDKEGTPQYFLALTAQGATALGFPRETLTKEEEASGN